MQHPDPKWTGAGGKSDTGISLGNDAPLSSKSRAPVQAVHEIDTEALAFGYGLPPATTAFLRNWGAGRFHARLAAEAARWLRARRKMRRRGAPSRHARMRSWRAST